MAKWNVTNGPTFSGAIRAVNYVSGTQRAKDAFGNEGPEIVVMRHRLEQLGPWGWQPIPVYEEGADGKLTEIPE